MTKGIVTVENIEPIQWDQSVKLAGNNATLAKDMLKGLVESLTPAQSSINQTYTQKDLKAMREAVHRLHGACCYCGVLPLKTAVAQLEMAISKSENDKLNFLLVELNKEINRLQQYYKNHPQYHITTAANVT